MKDFEVEFIINGENVTVAVPPYERLSDTIRKRLFLLGAKVSCERGECGACTVIMNGKPVNACLVLTATVEGKEILTVEGLQDGENLHPIQQSFVDEGGMQCGFCTCGMIMSAKALLDKNSQPTEEEIRKAISGNLCRCTGYETPVKSIQKAAKSMQGGK
jgi:carbon-monoxide dehydrogenase small subunit